MHTYVLTRSKRSPYERRDIELLPIIERAKARELVEDRNGEMRGLREVKRKSLMYFFQTLLIFARKVLQFSFI